MAAPVTFVDGTTAGVVTKDITPAMGIKTIQVRVPATFVWGTDIIQVDLKKYGANYISGFRCFYEDTSGSVVVAGTGTTAVASGVLSFTSTGSGPAIKGGTLIVFAY